MAGIPIYVLPSSSILLFTKDIDSLKSLKLKVSEVAWFQVYGIAAGKTLFEGEAYPDIEPSKFEFKDDIGFALASGNAGAFKVYADGKTYILGQTGQLIKWYYPEGAKYEYKQRIRQ